MSELPYTYTKDKPPLPETAEQLRARIPGWGVDLDRSVRPSVPRLQEKADLTGAHWEFPERQPELQPRERSIEHAQLTPVFGTSVPLKGLSGVLRRLAYRRYSEARLAHWLLLLLGDRVDAWESHATALLRLRPDDPVTETGVLSELRSHPVASRRGRPDVKHAWLDPVVVVGPYVVAGTVAWRVLRRLKG